MSLADTVRLLVAGMETAAAEDAARLIQAKERLAEAEQEVAAAEGRARATDHLLAVSLACLDALPAETPQEPDPAPVPEPTGNPAPPPVTALIKDFLRERGQATTAEILEHLRKRRPGTEAGGMSPELSKLVKSHVIERIRQGCYRFPTPTSESGTGGGQVI